MAAPSTSGAAPRPDEVAAYVASMARELKVMVERYDLSTLAYLLELVRLEAESRAADAPARFAKVESDRRAN